MVEYFCIISKFRTVFQNLKLTYFLATKQLHTFVYEILDENWQNFNIAQFYDFMISTICSI